MSQRFSYAEMRQLLQEEIWEGEGEVLTTLAEVKLPESEDVEGPTVKLVMLGKNGYPSVEAVEVLAKDDHSREVRIGTWAGNLEFPFDYPALAVPSDLSTQEAQAEASMYDDLIPCPIHLSVMCYCTEGRFDDPPDLSTE